MIKKLFKLLFILLLLLLVIAGVLYFLIKSGQVSLIGLSSMLEATGDISIVNLSDDRLSVDLDPTDPDAELGSYDASIEPLDTDGFGSIMAGEYELSLQPGGDCILDIGRGDSYTIISVPRGIAISKEGFDPSSADDVDFSTSSLCK